MRERGTRHIPHQWQPPDNLSSFWVKTPGRKGKCLKIDSDVYLKEYLARQEEMKKRPVPPARAKTVTKGKKYDTVGGVDGVGFLSDWITVEPDQFYRLEVDCMSPVSRKAPFVFALGYLLDTKRPKPYQRRRAYKKYAAGTVTASWKTFSTEFCPTKHSKKVRWLRVKLYVYWPPGVCYFDNVRLTPIPAPGTSRARTPRKGDGP